MPLTSKIGTWRLPENISQQPCPFYPGKTIGETHIAFPGIETVNLTRLQREYPAHGAPGAPNITNSLDIAMDRFYALPTARGEHFDDGVYLVLRGLVPGSERVKAFPEKPSSVLAHYPGYQQTTALIEVLASVLAFERERRYLNPGCFALTTTKIPFAVGGGFLVVGSGARGIHIDPLDLQRMRFATLGIGAFRFLERAE